MTSMLVDCHRDAPARPTDWRWQLAEATHSGQLPPSRVHPDRWVPRAIRFLSDQAASQGDTPCPGSALLDPALLGAFLVLFSGDPKLRSRLEARILANQAPAVIGALCQLPADVVEAYEALHFDVRDRLGAADYISAIVIGIVPNEGLTDIGALMKCFAYSGGAHVLDAVIAVLDAGELAGGGATSAESANEKLVRMTIAARAIPVTEKTALGLIRLQHRLRELEQRAAADSFTNVTIQASVEPWSTPTSGVGSGRPVRAFPVDLGRAIPAESIREVPGYRPGAITVVFPATGRSEPPTLTRRTA